MPPPAPPPPGRTPFKIIFKRTAIVIANLTSIVVFAREFPTWLEEGARVGWGEASLRSALRITIQAAIVSVVNTFLVALPVAGVIYYFRFLAERNSS